MSTNNEDVATLVSLLDDLDHDVAPVVRDRLIGMGPPVIGVLKSYRQQCRNNPQLLHRLDGIIAGIEVNRTVQAIIEWRSGKDPDLIHGMCLLSELICPEVHTAPIAQALFEMANEVWIELNDAQTSVEQVHLFNHIFYHRLGFRAEDPFLSELKPALPDYAVANRRANPILFGLIYLAFAFRSGVKIRAVAFPGGFMPVFVDNQDRILFYINIFNFGELLNEEQLFAFLADFGFVIPQKDFVLCDTVALVGIYTESFCIIAGNMDEKEMEQILEDLLACFGDKRYLVIEEDE